MSSRKRIVAEGEGVTAPEGASNRETDFLSEIPAGLQAPGPWPPDVRDGSLFQIGDFRLHSGEGAGWKIECDALTDGDIATVALMLSEVLPPFSMVEGVPTGGLRLAEAMKPYRRSSPATVGALLIVDDVLTTGRSMVAHREMILRGEGVWDEDPIGAVLFARGPCPAWVTPLFQMTTSGG